MKELGIALGLIFLLTGLVSGITLAEAEKTATVSANPTVVPSLDAFQANWVFSGRVATESGEFYNYYFEMQRDYNHLHAMAMLFDNQNHQVLLFEEGDAMIAHSNELANWQVGKTFLQFNPINDSWVFGVKTKKQKGFNFKVDFFGLDENAARKQDLRSGMELLVMQTGPLNGHLRTDGGSKEQFVMASSSWFKQIRTSKPQKSFDPLVGILCQFNDGSGFYAVNLLAADALQGAVAGWRDGRGASLPMSQFVTAKKNKEGVWSIGVASPKVHLALESVLDKEGQNYQLIAGLSKKMKPGFCTISKNETGQLQLFKTEVAKS